MCGITGYIGQSKDPELTYCLITSLFKQIECRGEDAAGFWGTQTGSDGKIIYHKEPIKASKLIKKPIWAQVANLNPDLLLAHARRTSIHSGEAEDNDNNHPFTSTDCSIGFVHNGTIPPTNYEFLRRKYEVFSECDSEIMLRIFEAGNAHGNDFEQLDDYNLPLNHRLAGIKDIWRYGGNTTAMAVGIGERLENGARRLWLFHNKFRSLWLADLRDVLGQIFFFSTVGIWQAALATPEITKYLNAQIKLIELPIEEVWLLNTNCQEPTVTDESLHRFRVYSHGLDNKKIDTKYQSKIQRNKPSCELLTDEDQLHLPCIDFEQHDRQAGIQNVEGVCQEISTHLESIQVYITHAVEEGAFSPYKYQDLMAKLIDVKSDLKTACSILDC